MKVVAVVPVKSVSERVESKNFKPFYAGKSLFDLLLEDLLSSNNIDEVYVSSDAAELKKQVEEMGCNFILRPEEFCNNNIPWSDVISHVAASIPEDDDATIAWCHTTSPLFDEYDEAIDAYKRSTANGKYDGLVVVTELSEFIVSEKKQPVNYSWGPWHRYSQYLDKLYAITGALFITSKKQMVDNRYVVSRNPNFYKVNQLKSIDVDTEYDFKLAQLLMEHKEDLINA